MTVLYLRMTVMTMLMKSSALVGGSVARRVTVITLVTYRVTSLTLLDLIVSASDLVVTMCPKATSLIGLVDQTA